MNTIARVRSCLVRDSAQDSTRPNLRNPFFAQFVSNRTVQTTVLFSSRARKMNFRSFTIMMMSGSKFSSPPTIGNYAKHESWIKLLEQIDPKANLDPSTIPNQLRVFAEKHSLRPTKEEEELQRAAEALPRAGMVGAPDEANLLCMLLEMMNAKRVVEVGVFRGVTTLAFAQCLKKMNAKDSKVYGLDISSEFAEIGKKYWKLAVVDDLIDLRIGDAKDSMSELIKELGENSVDMCFIDADKTGYDDYYEKSVQLTKSGGLIVVDNTLWSGYVSVPDEILIPLAEKAKDYSMEDKTDEAELARRAVETLAIKKLASKIFQDDRIERVSFLTIADGVTICRKK
jgi:predicted O-methyltransferase YrrM